jgi:uncharacterized protein YkwD
MMNRRAFVLVLILAGCGGVGPQPTPTPVPVPPAPAAVVQELLSAHNKLRSARGLPDFILDPKLSSAANGHAAFMDQHGVMAHEAIGDGSPWTRITAAGYSYSSAAENIAMDPQGVQGVMVLWERSPLHLINIMGPYRDVGFGVSGSYYCVDFGTSVGTTTAPEGPAASSTSHSRQ